MFDGSMIIPLILNIVLLSIPEESFLVVFSLIVMKRFDLLALKKSNIIRIFLIALLVGSFTTTFRAIGIFDGNTAPIITLLSVFALTVLFSGIKSAKGILKAFLSTCAAVLAIMAMELVLYPVFYSIPGFSAEEANKLGWLPIILTIPERTMQIILVAMILLKRHSFMKLGFFKVITRNRILAYITGGLIIFNVIFLYIMFRLILINNILSGTGTVMKLLVVSLAIAFPLLNMSVLLGVINYSVNKYTHTRLYVQEEVKVLRVLVHMLMQQNRYAEVDIQMESFVDEIKKIK